MPNEVKPLTEGRQVAAGIQIETRGRQVASPVMGLTPSNAEPAPPPPMGSQNVNNGNGE